MPAQFFLDSDAPGAKSLGTSNAYKRFSTFMRTNEIPLSAGLPALGRDAIHAAISELWDGLGGDIPVLKANVTGLINAELSDLEVALLSFIVLQEKFTQYGATLPGGGGP